MTMDWPDDPKGRLMRSMQEYVRDSRKIKWPQQMETIEDAIHFEDEVIKAIDDYEYSVSQILDIIEICFEQSSVNPRDIREEVDLFITFDLPRLLAEYLIGQDYFEDDARKFKEFIKLHTR